ncbi:hypothetical protein WCP94_003989 [Bilophila wadsworthia]
MLFVYSMEYGRYKILYHAEIINVFLKKRVAGGRKKKRHVQRTCRVP